MPNDSSKSTNASCMAVQAGWLTCGLPNKEEFDSCCSCSKAQSISFEFLQVQKQHLLIRDQEAPRSVKYLSAAMMADLKTG